MGKSIRGFTGAPSKATPLPDEVPFSVPLTPPRSPQAARDELEQILNAAILNNGFPHVGHNQLCHEADAKLVRAALAAATPEPPDLSAAAEDVRYAGGNGTSDYWRGFNDGIDKLVERLAQQPETGHD